MNLKLVPYEGVTPRCALCHDDALDDALSCPGCRTLVHPECRAARCPTLGCVARPLRTPAATVVPFACLEALAILLILAVLGAVVVVNVMGTPCRQRVPRPRADMRSIGDALNLYKIDTGRYPEQLSSLWERPADVRRWNGPYLREYPPRDPWGDEYLYTFSGGASYEIVSYGADGAPGGVDEEADLSSRTINALD